MVRITKAKKYSQTTRRIAEGIRQVAGRPTRNCVAIEPQTAQIEQIAGGIGSSSLVRMKKETGTHEIHKHLHKEIHSQRQIQQQNLSGLEKQTSKSTSFRSVEQNEIEFESDNSYGTQHHSYNARMFLQKLRLKHDEELRREIATGTGPEVRRS